MTTTSMSTRPFWAGVLAKASTSELRQIVETLTARHAANPNEADSDLLVLARCALRTRPAGGGRPGGADRSVPSAGSGHDT